MGTCPYSYFEGGRGRRGTEPTKGYGTQTKGAAVNCNYCGRLVEQDKAVIVSTNVGQEIYCGSPATLTDGESCWQQMIRGWYWSMTSSNNGDNGERRETSPRPSFRRVAVLAPMRRP